MNPTKVSWKVAITSGTGVHAVTRFVGVRTKREGLEMIARWRKTENSADNSVVLRRNGVEVKS